MKKLLLLILMIPTISFAEKYDSQYYKDWIEGECIQQSYMANNDFVAKKIYKRCEKSAKKCIAIAKNNKPTNLTHKGAFMFCMQEEIVWKGDSSPKF